MVTRAWPTQSTQLLPWLLIVFLLSGCGGGSGRLVGAGGTPSTPAAEVALLAAGAAVYSAGQDADLATPGVQKNLTASLGVTVAGKPLDLYSTVQATPSQPLAMVLVAQGLADAGGAVTFYRVTVFDGQRIEVRTASGDILRSSQLALNRPPTVNAGFDQSVVLGAQVRLSGAASDPESQLLTYTWSPVASVAGVSVTSSGSLGTAVGLPGVGSYVFRLTARDPFGDQATDEVQVTVTSPSAPPPPNRAPTATVARSELTLTAGAPALISGGGTDPDTSPADTLTYQWTQLSGPSATLADTGKAQLKFTPGDGLYLLQLLVSDGRGATSTAQVNVLGVAIDATAQAAIESATKNSIAFHTASSSKSVQSCKFCHGSVLTSRVLDPKVETVHYRHHLSETGPQMACTECHVSVDLLSKSAAHLRRQVAMTKCLSCHGTRFFAVRNLN